MGYFDTLTFPKKNIKHLIPDIIYDEMNDDISFQTKDLGAGYKFRFGHGTIKDNIIILDGNILEDSFYKETERYDQNYFEDYIYKDDFSIELIGNDDKYWIEIAIIISNGFIKDYILGEIILRNK